MAQREYTCEADILCGVNLPKDINSPTELEQKHLPVISAPDRVKRNEVFPVTVELGKSIVHPNEPGHFIEWVELYSGDTFLFRAHLSGSLSEPKVTIPVKLTHAHGPLKAWGKCNLHGLWEGTKDIQVED
jgi:superoxide reductase